MLGTIYRFLKSRALNLLIQTVLLMRSINFTCRSFVKVVKKVKSNSTSKWIAEEELLIYDHKMQPM